MYRTACRQPSVNGSADFGSHLACRESWWYIRGVETRNDTIGPA